MVLRTIKEIDKDIEAAKKELETIKGTPTELYTRIVGYYRPVANWNPGKREEYKIRKVFKHE